jgi:hypothetical protein
MATSRLDHRITIDSRTETGSQPNVERDADRETGGGLFRKSPVYHDQKEERGKKDVSIRVNEHWNFMPF